MKHKCVFCGRELPERFMQEVRGEWECISLEQCVKAKRPARQYHRQQWGDHGDE